MPTPALCRGRLPSHWRPPLPGVGSRTATYPVADSRQARRFGQRTGNPEYKQGMKYTIANKNWAYNITISVNTTTLLHSNENCHRRRNSFQVGGAKILVRRLLFSKRAPCNYLFAAHLKEIDRLRCFVVINFHIAVFHPVFENVNHFSRSTMGLTGIRTMHFLTGMSGLSWQKCEKT